MAVRHAGPTRTRTGGASQGGRFARDLGPSALTLLTLGGMMGSGLFVASGMAGHDAGPFLIPLFVIGFLAMAMEITALGEMSAADPRPGSFLVYAREVLGPGYTFVGGWIYWFSSVLTMSSEVTAAALLSRQWAPSVPLWLWALGYSVAVVAANFVSVRGFGEVEGALAAIKSAAVLAFLGAGAAFLAGGGPRPAPAAPWAGLLRGPLLPGGPGGAAAGLLLVLFAYAGTGVIGMAAAETRDPARTVPGAVRATLVLSAVMYVGGVVVLLLLLPWSQLPVHASPFVTAIARTGLPYAGAVMNFVLLLAVLSTMNAALYANVRVLYTLARQRQAPAGLGRLSRRGLPAAAIWVSAAALGGTIILAYLLPSKAYAYLVTATGFQAMAIWLLILFTHLRYRPRLDRQKGTARFRLPGYPVTTLVPVAVVLVALAGSWTVPSERVGAAAGLAGIALAAAAWLFVGRARLSAEPPR